LGGPGLLESIYESSLCYELKDRKLKIKNQLMVPVKYKNTIVGNPLCLDILVENKVIIEVKATEREHSVHYAVTSDLSSNNGYEVRTSYKFWSELCKRRYSKSC